MPATSLPPRPQERASWTATLRAVDEFAEHTDPGVDPLVLAAAACGWHHDALWSAVVDELCAYPIRSALRHPAMIAASPHLPPVHRPRLLTHRTATVAAWVAANPTCTTAELGALIEAWPASGAATSSPLVAALANPNASPVTLGLYARFPHSEVRRVVAANPATPAIAIALASKDPIGAVAGAAAQNPSAAHQHTSGRSAQRVVTTYQLGGFDLVRTLLEKRDAAR